jgi:hypothetical protein
MSPPIALDVVRVVEPPTLYPAIASDWRARRLARLLTRRLDRVQRGRAQRIDRALTARRVAAERESIARAALLTAFSQCGLR